MYLPDKGTMISDGSVAAGILHYGAKIGVVDRSLRVIPEDQLDAHGLGPRDEHIPGLGKDIFIDKEFRNGDVLMVLILQVKEHGHCLRSGRALIQQRSIGQRQRRQVGHHGLEVQQAFQPALGDLGLVRGVLRVPSWIFEYIAQDHAGYDDIIISLADIGSEDFIAGGYLPELGEVLKFADGSWYVQRVLAADG